MTYHNKSQGKFVKFNKLFKSVTVWTRLGAIKSRNEEAFKVPVVSTYSKQVNSREANLNVMVIIII